MQYIRALACILVHMISEPELVSERHAWLLDRLFKTRKLLTTDIATELGISVDTVRRDLRSLHDQGLLRRVHGGAVPISPLPTSFADRQAEPGETRSRLAAAVVDRFRADQVIGLDAGSTNVEVALLIPPTLAITIVTNNPAVAVALAGHQAAKVIMLGGHIDLQWMAAVGPEAVDGWRNYRLDLGVLGVCGLDRSVGASTNSHAEVATKRALIEASAEVVVPVQAEKLATAAPYVVAEAEALDIVLVEDNTEEDYLTALGLAGVEVVIAR